MVWDKFPCKKDLEGNRTQLTGLFAGGAEKGMKAR